MAEFALSMLERWVRVGDELRERPPAALLTP